VTAEIGQNPPRLADIPGSMSIAESKRVVTDRKLNGL
jgi:hypothetical protein